MRIGAGLGVMLFAAAPADDVPQCRLRHVIATEAPSMVSLPETIGEDFLHRLDRRDAANAAADRQRLIAERGAAYNPTDVKDPKLPPRRFLRAGLAGRYWFIWYEHGGRGRHAHLVLYDAAPKPAHLVANYALFADDLCAATDAALDDLPLPQSVVRSKEW